MSLEGILGSGGGSLGLLDAAAGIDVSDCRDAGRIEGCCGFNETSGFSLDNGGGYGDIEMLVTEAECA